MRSWGAGCPSTSPKVERPRFKHRTEVPAGPRPQLDLAALADRGLHMTPRGCLLLSAPLPSFCRSRICTAWHSSGVRPLKLSGPQLRLLHVRSNNPNSEGCRLSPSGKPRPVREGRPQKETPRGHPHDAPGREANLRVPTLHDAPVDVGIQKLVFRFVLHQPLLEQRPQPTVCTASRV